MKIQLKRNSASSSSMLNSLSPGEPLWFKDQLYIGSVGGTAAGAGTQESGGVLTSGSPIKVWDPNSRPWLEDGFTYPRAVQDADGNWYRAVVIGNQVWLAENWRCTRLPDGTPLVRQTGEEEADFSDTEARYFDWSMTFAWYRYRYGLLYNGVALMNGADMSGASPSGVQGLAPNGWHIPSSAEFTTLIEWIKSQPRYRYTNYGVARALSTDKTSRITTTSDQNKTGLLLDQNNKSGFDLAYGGRFYSGYNTASRPTYRAFLWTASESSVSAGDFAIFSQGYTDEVPSLTTYASSRKNFYSVRLLSDKTPQQFWDWYTRNYGTYYWHQNEPRKLWVDHDVSSLLGSDVTPTEDYLSSSNSWLHTYSAIKKFLIPLNNIIRVKIKARPSNAAIIAFCKGPITNTNTSGTRQQATVVSGHGWTTVSAGDEQSFEVPAEAEYLYVAYNSGSYGTTINIPDYIYFTGCGITEHTGDGSGFIKDDGSVDHNTYALSSAFDSYLPLSGGSETSNLMTGPIFRKFTNAADSPMICMASGNYDNWLWRIKAADVSGETPYPVTSQAYGFGAKYRGSGPGNNNSYQFWADNQTGEAVKAIEIFQDGKMTIAADVTVNAGVTASGSVTAGSFVKTGGTSSQFLKADGSVDTNSYALASAIPTVNNATLTLAGGGGLTVSADPTFTANASSNKTITITHPSATAYASGFYKITINDTGHVTAASAVTATDITGLVGTHAGGTQVTLNGNGGGANADVSIYAPVGSGTTGQYLKSNGENAAPTWTSFDTAISEVSTNAVQNQAVGTELVKLWDKKNIASRLNPSSDAGSTAPSSAWQSSYNTYYTCYINSYGEWVRNGIWNVANSDITEGTSTYAGKHTILPLTNIKKVGFRRYRSVSSGGTVTTRRSAIAFLKSYTPPTSETLPVSEFATGTSIIFSNTDTVNWYDVPNDAVWLYVWTWYGYDGNHFPNAEFLLTGIGITEYEGTGSGFVKDDGTVDTKAYITADDLPADSDEKVTPVLLAAGDSDFPLLTVHSRTSPTTNGNPNYCSGVTVNGYGVIKPVSVYIRKGGLGPNENQNKSVTIEGEQGITMYTSAVNDEVGQTPRIIFKRPSAYTSFDVWNKNGYLAIRGYTSSDELGLIEISGSGNIKLPSTPPSGGYITVSGTTSGSGGFFKSDGSIDYNSYLTSFTETDPTVPAWAKAADKPLYNLDEVLDGESRKLLTIGTTGTTAAAGDHNHDSTYVKFDPGTTEQVIKTSIGTFSRGVITLYRTTGDHYTFMGFSNKGSDNNEKYLGGIGFKSTTDSDLYIRHTTDNAIENAAVYTQVWSGANLIGENIFDETDIVGLLRKRYDDRRYYISSNGSWSNSSYYHWAIPLDGVRKVKVKANSTKAAIIAFLASYTPNVGTTTAPSSTFSSVTGFGSRLSVAIGDTEEYVVPSDAKFLYVYGGTNSSVDATPESVKLTGWGITEHRGSGDKYIKDNGTLGNISEFATASHSHGSITNDGKVGTASGKPLITTDGGAVTTGSFGTASGTFCEGNDSRLSDARTPSNDSNLVHKDNAETITGMKTFSNGLIINTAQTWTSSDRAIPFSQDSASTTIRYVSDDAIKGLTFNPNTGVLKAAKFVKRDPSNNNGILLADGSDIPQGTFLTSHQTVTGTTSLLLSSSDQTYLTVGTTAYKMRLPSASTSAAGIVQLGTTSGTAAEGDHTHNYIPTAAATGSTTKPIYLSAQNTFTTCSDYAGGTAVTLNGTSKAASTASFYAPTGAGTSGQYLKSNGSGAPSWVDLPADSDTKVTQTKTTTDTNTSWRPVILGAKYAATAPSASVAFTFDSPVTDTTYATHLAAFKPNTGTLAVVGLKKFDSSGKLADNSDTKLWNTNGGIVTIGESGGPAAFDHNHDSSYVPQPSISVGGATTPVYWNGSALTACDPYTDKKVEPVSLGTSGSNLYPFLTVNNSSAPTTNGQPNYRASVGVTGAGDLMQNAANIIFGRVTGTTTATDAIRWDRGTSSSRRSWQLLSDSSQNFALQTKVAGGTFSSVITVSKTELAVDPTTMTDGVKAAKFVKDGSSAGEVLLGNGSSVTAASTAGKVLTSAASGAPTWADLPAASTAAAGIVQLGTTSGTAAEGNHTHNYIPTAAATGSTTKPIYLSAQNTFTECSQFAGGTAVTLNGDSKAADTASFYAPTTAGDAGKYLKSNGSGAPSWADLPADSDTKVTQTKTADTNSSWRPFIIGKQYAGSTPSTSTALNFNNPASDPTDTVYATHLGGFKPSTGEIIVGGIKRIDSSTGKLIAGSTKDVWNTNGNTTTLADVATTGSYNDLDDTPTITDEKVTPEPDANSTAYPMLLANNSSTPTTNGKPKYSANLSATGTGDIVFTKSSTTGTIQYDGTDKCFKFIFS